MGHLIKSFAGIAIGSIISVEPIVNSRIYFYDLFFKGIFK